MNGLSGIPEIEQNYEIGETLGEGGYGVVVKAYHKRLRKDVVIKESKLVVSEDKARAEVDILKNLHHPNLPQVFDFFIYKDKSYTVMDFIDGKSVGNLLKQPGFRFTTKEIYNYSRQLLNALDYLHSRPVPIIHGDIKPDNVMITREGNLYLIDFNISSVSDGNTAYTYGYTHGYGAPEQEAAFKEIVEKLRTPGIINTSSRSMRSSGVNGAAPSPNKRASTSSDQSADATEAYIEDPDITAEYTESMDSASQADRQDTGNVSGSEAADRKYIISAAAAARPDNLKIPITMRSDVYSAGATIYRMYIGKVYSSENGTTIVSGNVSEAFINFLNKALQQNPAKRYASGSKMLEALKQVYKKDKEYRKLCIRTVVARLIIIAALAAGIICIRQGRILKSKERESEYNRIVNEMAVETEIINSAGIPENSPAYAAGSIPAVDASAANIEKLYTSATELFENRPEAYYQKALSLYELHEYGKADEYIYSVLGNSSIEFEPSDKEKLYYIQGNCLYQLGYLKEAAEAFENSISNGTSNPSVYCDYAIVLNALGMSAESEQMLKEAEKNGIGNDLLLLTEGEISLGSIAEDETRYVTAALDVVKTFQKCLETSKDEYIRYRAYLGIGHAYDAVFAHMTAGDISAYSPGTKKEVLDKEITLLENAIDELPQKYRIQLYENLVLSCDRAYAVTSEPGYDTKAVGALEKIVESGHATMVTYENMCNIFRRQSRFDDALHILNKMESKYPDNYRVYMLFAFTYAQIEAQKDVDSRDYTKFFEYCDKAEQLYSRVSVPDIEMQSLHEIYTEICNNGWQ